MGPVTHDGTKRCLPTEAVSPGKSLCACNALVSRVAASSMLVRTHRLPFELHPSVAVVLLDKQENNFKVESWTDHIVCAPHNFLM
eukprot:3249084-Amphidinium_carterae.1